MFALVNGSRIKRVGMNKADLDADRLDSTETILNVYYEGIADDEIAVEGTSVEYEVKDDHVIGRTPARRMTTEERLERVREMRSATYSPIGDQLDALMKGFEALRAQGISFPKETNEWIDTCRVTKSRYPKPSAEGAKLVP